MYKYPFNKPFVHGKELIFVNEALKNGHISGDGAFTLKCQEFFSDKFDLENSLLTTSCTDALEICALSLNIASGDEIIMPSYTFVSTANAFALRGAVPVFIDSEADTPNINVDRIEKKISSATKAIVIVHYAGIACDIDAIKYIASKYDIPVIEDAAQAIGSKYKGHFLGGFGSLSTFSFHETKNINCGEGGAIVVNDKRMHPIIEIIREKGTNRSSFLRGEIDKYTWVSLGSSFLPSDLLSAYLYGQLLNYDVIQSHRTYLWNVYDQILSDHTQKQLHNYSTPFIPSYAEGNSHIYYLVVKSVDFRTKLIQALKAEGILAVSHYVALHNSPFAKRFAHNLNEQDFTNCNKFAGQLIRLPLYHELTGEDVEYIALKVLELMSNI